MGCLQEDEPAEDGMSKAEVLKVLKLHMDDIKVSLPRSKRLSPGPQDICCAVF